MDEGMCYVLTISFREADFASDCSGGSKKWMTQKWEPDLLASISVMS